MDIKDIAKQLGRLGGEKTKLRGKEYYSQIGKKGAKKRWRKKLSVSQQTK